MHRLGKSGLRLKFFLEDRMMGARPIGMLALSLALAYFVGVLLVILHFSTSVLTIPVYQGLLFSLVLVGVVMFFLPLNIIHAKMQAEKASQRRRTLGRFLSLDSDGIGSVSENGEVSLKDVQSTLSKLVGLKELEISEKRLSSVPTWPFDIQVVGKFVTIVLSITAVLLSRIIAGLLHI